MNIDTAFSIFCGADIADRAEPVSDSEFSAFLRVHVTPRFPGFTVRIGSGYWNGKPETVREILILADSAERANIRAIARSYSGRFRQECALVTESPVSVSFESPVF